MTASWSRSRLVRTLAVAIVATLALATAGLAKKRMESTKLGPRLCETTFGGKFVSIPGFPGEKVDRRLLADIKWIEHRYPIFITDGYSMDSVHAENGEHPLGLALDIVPGPGGSWRDIDRLAKWAEPSQNHPRPPFRWVGWNGDANHGDPQHCKIRKGCPAHLHLSWSHTPSRPRHPARTVWVFGVRS